MIAFAQTFALTQSCGSALCNQEGDDLHGASAFPQLVDHFFVIRIFIVVFEHEPGPDASTSRRSSPA